MARIYISPSTQDWNQYAGGGTGTADSEEAWMRVVAFPLADLLRSAGHTVKVGGTQSWSANAAESNAWNADYHYAIHSNAGGGHGTEVWFWGRNSTTYSKVGKRMADALYATVAPVSNFPDRGVKMSDDYGELNNTNAPAVIIELLFHDNVVEAEEMRRDHAEFSLALAKGILKVAGGTLPVAATYLIGQEHMAASEKASAQASADARGNVIRFYKTTKDSWKSWPPSNG